MSIGHIVSGEYLHPVGTEAAPSLRRATGDDRRVSLIVAPLTCRVLTDSFCRHNGDRDPLSAQNYTCTRAMPHTR